ncbi:MAG TPA: DUF4389 domain-containing protein [Candidatus Saccharimonadales bacterium]|nr:DUF4389 domain-containing protein [Candidatus Saccharimonadales bacterium]
MASKNMYPDINIKRIKNPNRLYAIPLFGFLVKLIMIIPVGIYMVILSFAWFFVWIINSFYILFNGKYWNVGYNFSSGLIHLSAKIAFFMFGMTDTYPGFDFAIDDSFSISITYPKKPNRWLAIPLFGFLARLILLIPFLIYQTVLSKAAQIALVVGSFFVTFTGKYPESDYEINRDSYRLDQAAFMWFAGLSDTYPSFWISMNHSGIKITLIILSILLNVVGFSFRKDHHREKMQNNYNYYGSQTSIPQQDNYFNQK